MKKTTKITIELLEKWGSCYSHEQHLKLFGRRDFVTPMQVVRTKKIPIQDKIWVLLHQEIIPEKELRLLACGFAESALKFIEKPDQRSVSAIAVSRSFAHGTATTAELIAARDAARDAAGAAAWAAAWDAAGAAAWAAAWDAARDAARDAAGAAAWAAAWDAAGAAAWAAAWDAAWAAAAAGAAAWAVRDAARAAADNARKEQLSKIKGELGSGQSNLTEEFLNESEIFRR